MVRALFLFLVAAPIMALDAAQAQQAGGIQVAPVMIAMSAEHNIASLRVRNGRDRAVAFEVDVFDWRQDNGRDVLTPTRDLLVAPGVFEVRAESEQVVRLGVLTANANRERAFRIILRELPPQRESGSVLGFTLELSLPVFIAPIEARGQVEARAEERPWGPVLIIANTGRTHVRLAALETAEAGPVQAPRYLLAGANAEIQLPRQARTIRLVSADIGGAEIERIIHVGRPSQRADLR